MTEDRAIAAVPDARKEEDADRLLWLAVRQGLLLVVVAIEKRYGLRSSKTEDRAA